MSTLTTCFLSCPLHAANKDKDKKTKSTPDHKKPTPSDQPKPSPQGTATEASDHATPTQMQHATIIVSSSPVKPAITSPAKTPTKTITSPGGTVQMKTLSTDNKQVSIGRQGYISLLLPRLPKLPNQCNSNGPGNLAISTAVKKYSVIVFNSAENRDPNLNRLIGLFNERSSILDRSLSHSKRVTMNLGRDYKSGTQPQLTCPTYLRH